jgi:hypothetical protein
VADLGRIGRESAAVTTPPLELLADRCKLLADRVRSGNMRFIEAVDFAYSAADFAGLVEIYGDDQIQTVLANAFMDCRA